MKILYKKRHGINDKKKALFRAFLFFIFFIVNVFYQCSTSFQIFFFTIYMMTAKNVRNKTTFNPMRLRAS